MKRLHRIVWSLCLSLLLCVTCSSLFSVKVSAAEVSPDLNEQWFLIPYSAVNGMKGTFDSNSGLYKYSGSHSASGNFLFFTDGYESGVFPKFLAGHKYLIYVTVTANGSQGATFWDLGFRINAESPDSFRFEDVSMLNNYVNGATNWTAFYSFEPLQNLTVGSGSAFFFASTQSSFNGRFDWAFYGLDVTEDTESEVNQIIAAIQDQTGQIKDKIDEVLTPEGENNLGEAVDQITDQVQENLGALGFAHDTVENFIGLFNEEPPAPVINVPPLKMKIKGVEHQFFNGYQYDFRSMEEGGLSVLVGAVRTAGTLVLWWAFLQYCLKEFDQFFRR